MFSFKPVIRRGLFAAQGIVFVEQVSCTVPLALTISQRLGIHAEAAYGQMSRRSWGEGQDEV